MSAFEWMELEHLTNEIDALRDHMIEAKSRKAIARTRALGEEITRLEQRRDKLLTYLTTHMISTSEARTQARSRRDESSVEDRSTEPTGNEQSAAAVADLGEHASQPAAAQAGEQPAPNKENPDQQAMLESVTRGITVSRVRLAAAKMQKDRDLVGALEKQIDTGEARRRRQLANVAGGEAAATQGGHHVEMVEHPTEQSATAVSEDNARHMTGFPPEPSHLLTGDPEIDGCDHALAAAQERSAYEAEGDGHPSTSDDCSVASDAASSPADTTPRGELPQAKVGEEQHIVEPGAHVVANAAAASTIDPKVDDPEGERTMWDQAELEHTKKEIETRRDEMLERHSRELKEMLANQAAELRQLDADRSELEALEKAIGAALRKFKAPPADDGVTKLDDERALRQQGLS